MPDQTHSERRQRLLNMIAENLKTSNWTDWARMPTWTATEAAALTLELCPTAVTQYDRWQHPLLQRFTTLRKMIHRACAVEELPSSKHGIEPAIYLKWASKYELAVPAELAAEVLRVQERAARRPKDKPLGSRERDTYLKLIIGLAIGGYAYDPAAAKSNTVNEIHTDLALRGINLDPETIRRKLKEAVSLLGDEFHQVSTGQ